MKSSKFYPPSPQAPKISDKTIAEYAALSDAERAKISKKPQVGKYTGKYKKRHLFAVVRSWFKEHWFDFVMLLITIVALVVDLIH